ncbi:MAG: SRPBCC domain-containing protein [Flavobacteriales bacterium]|nr:SRPBCC domain-containing protein [Flavobacteriales bacterium]
MKDLIQKEHQFSHPIGDVWNAISKAEEISKWFIPADFKAEPGYAYKFSHTDENSGNCTNITGKVLEANPVNRLVYTWMVEGMDIETTVTWNLEENDKGTLLTLEHSGISNFPGETAVKMFESFDGGWNNCIVELDKYLKELINV